VLGLLFGIVGSLFMVIAALLAVRKRLPTWRVGSAKGWLRAHLWLGTVGFVLILFHSGFAWGGLLENLLWISFGLVVVTGFAGLALQQVIPKLLTSEVPLETFVAQISFLTKTMLFRADQLVATHTGPLDVLFENLTPFATAVLKQQGVLKRESDLPKELAKVYANVPQPEGEKKGHAAEKPAAAPKPTAGVAPAVVAPATVAPAAVASIEPTVPQGNPNPVPATKPKSPLQLMQEKKAATAAASIEATATVEPVATLAALPSEKKLSPLELMRAKKAALQSSTATATTTTSEPVAAATESSSSPIAAEPIATPEIAPSEKKLSPIELMRAKKAALQSSTATTTTTSEPVAAATESSSSPIAAEPIATPEIAPSEKKLSPIELMRAKKATALQSSTATATTTTSEPVVAPASDRKLSPVEIMRAKMSAEKGSPADKPVDAPKPLTIEQSTEGLTLPRSPEQVASQVAAPPVVKKPLPVSKPVASSDAGATSAATKPKAVVISSIQISELRDFHLKIVRPYLDNGISPQHGLNELITARRLFGQLKADLPAELHEILEQLAAFCEERRQFAVQKRLHRWMHWWLILHIPPSIALLVLFVAHVVMSLRVVPFGR
jgi:hypothetical protein